MDLDRIAGREGNRHEDEGDEAAVLIPVIQRSEGPHLLFTKRSDELSDHPGQMSFPGGQRETHDHSLLETALREAHEEVGLRPDRVDRVGELDDIITVTNYVIRPFVARVPDQTYVPESIEVAEIAILPFDAFRWPENYTWDRHPREEKADRIVDSFHVEDYRIWGATGRLVVQLLERTTDWRREQRIEEEPF